MIDLLVVGGGPAGLATAIRARLAGLTVTVIDRARPPIDKACGEGLMPDAVKRLREIGIEPRGSPFRGIRYVDGNLVAEGHFPGSGGLGVRRTELHAALVQRAEEVGVDLRWGVKAEGLTSEGVRTDQGILAARWIVGADGLRSQVRRWAGLDGPLSRQRRFGVRRHFGLAPWSDCVEVHWGPESEAYVTPVSGDEVGIAVLWSGHKAGFDGLLEGFPALKKRVEGAPVASGDRGMGPLRQQVRAVTQGRVALVGDAAGYLDAITGEGLAVTLHESAALVEALLAGDLSRYTAAHRRINRLPNFMTSMVLALEPRPGLRRRVLRALAAEPSLFARLLGIHARTLPPRDIGFEGALRLAWRLVAA
ncbi:MAG TPA: NAD(P)/FAD-dependent oxidoreductase [Thermoanaerobaculia bacterium]|nr:NAD(P)/FAD-dependent oxidoreductase [Thermoanaerobaculia bacterium]